MEARALVQGLRQWRHQSEARGIGTIARTLEYAYGDERRQPSALSTICEAIFDASICTLTIPLRS
jgi:hypothetical protein